MVKRLFPGVSCSFRLPAFFCCNWCRLPLQEVLRFLGLCGTLGYNVICWVDFFLLLDVYIFELIQCNCFLFAIMFR